MVDIRSKRREVTELIRSLRANWTRFLSIHVAVSVLVFTILTPLATALLRLSVSLSGKAALSDQDILFFFLSPAGFLALLLLGSVFSIIIFLEHAALLVVARSVQAGRAATVKEVLLFLAGRMAGLFQLAVLVLLRVLLNLLPFLLLVLLLYRNCTKLHQSAPNCTKLHRNCTKLHQSAPKLLQTAPICTKLHQSAPKLHQTAPICTKLHQSAPKLHQTAPICTELHQSAPICTNLHQTAPKLNQTAPI